MAAPQRLDQITFESFERLAGQGVTFVFEQPGASPTRHQFEVIEVRPNLRVAEMMQAAQEDSLYKRVPFSVLFRVEEAPPFVQALLRLDHEDFEDCHLLVTRVMAPGRDPSQAWFEAVFG